MGSAVRWLAFGWAVIAGAVFCAGLGWRVGAITATVATAGMGLTAWLIDGVPTWRARWQGLPPPPDMWRVNDTEDPD